MDTDSIPILLALFVLLLLSAFFSATETAFSSLNQIKLKTLAASGDKRAAKTLATVEKYDKLLTTILVGNNVVNIAMSAIATVLFIGWLGNGGATVSTAIVTVVVLIFGEITPKSLAKESPERFAMAVTPVIRFVMLLLTPVNFLFTCWKKLLLRVFRLRSEKTVTEEDLLTIVDEAETVGELRAEESEIIRSAIEFRELEAVDVLTPRVHMTAVDVSTPVQEIFELFRESEYSRIPVFDETPDKILGIVNQKDFYERVMIRDEDFRSVITPVPFVPESAKIADLLQLMREKRCHMVVVVDEYGGTAGILTMEDILEELVGEIYDEHDEVEIALRPAGEGYRALGLSSVEDFFEALGYEEETTATTVGGWVMEKLERIPVKGDRFTAGSLAVTVTKVRDHSPVEIYVRVKPDKES